MTIRSVFFAPFLCVMSIAQFAPVVLREQPVVIETPRHKKPKAPIPALPKDVEECISAICHYLPFYPLHKNPAKKISHLHHQHQELIICTIFDLLIDPQDVRHFNTYAHVIRLCTHITRDYPQLGALFAAERTYTVSTFIAAVNTLAAGDMPTLLQEKVAQIKQEISALSYYSQFILSRQLAQKFS